MAQEDRYNFFKKKKKTCYVTNELMAIFQGLYRFLFKRFLWFSVNLGIFMRVKIMVLDDLGFTVLVSMYFDYHDIHIVVAAKQFS